MTKMRREPNTASSMLFAGLHAGKGRRKRKLTEEERTELIRTLATRADPGEFDVHELAPPGSFLARMLRHFDQTDISYALPLMQLVMVTASWLTQRGATVEVPGLEPLQPTLWTVGLAESGSSKTLAADEVMRILSHDGGPPVTLLPAPGSDAQWIEDLAAFNRSFWFQDEVGKFCDKVLNNALFARIKPWMLDAYSSKPISNRLKGEQRKLVIERPMFTFHGLSVFETWKSDVDLGSMLDGFCQRFNFYVPTRRTDTDMFDHFLYLAGEASDARRAELGHLWQVLCRQEGADEPYALQPDVLPHLETWWLSLRESWGGTPLPRSFMRRTGFSVMRYLPVLHFLLGKARHPIDLETAHLATRYAEYHFRSAMAVLQDYDKAGTGRIRKVVEVHRAISDSGKSPSTRDISRRLSARQRADLPTDLLAEVVSVLDRIEDVPGLIDEGMTPRDKGVAIAERFNAISDRLKLSERKRNERRLRELCRTDAARQIPDDATSDQIDDRSSVVSFESRGTTPPCREAC